jgi:hypothetical protein
MPTSFKDLLEAFEFVGMSGSLGENLAFLDRRTGKIYWHTEFADVAELYDELPDDVDLIDGTSSKQRRPSKRCATGARSIR